MVREPSCDDFADTVNATQHHHFFRLERVDDVGRVARRDDLHLRSIDEHCTNGGDQIGLRSRVKPSIEVVEENDSGADLLMKNRQNGDGKQRALARHLGGELACGTGKFKLQLVGDGKVAICVWTPGGCSTD